MKARRPRSSHATEPQRAVHRKPIPIPMYGLPEEAVGRHAVIATHAKELLAMTETLRLSLALIASGGIHFKPARGLDESVVPVIVGLYTRACRLFRSIQIVAEAGLAENAETLNRTLFEMLVLIGWILQKHSTTRAEMYIAHLSLRNQKILREMKQTHGLKRWARQSLVAQVDSNVAAHSKLYSRLPPAIVKQMASTYSGMSLKDTAKSIGALVAYQLYYRLASGPAHGSDLMSHIAFTGEESPTLVLNIGPGPSRELATIASAASVFLVCIAMAVDKKFNLRYQARLKAFGQQELGMKWRGRTMAIPPPAPSPVPSIT